MRAFAQSKDCGGMFSSENIPFLYVNTLVIFLYEFVDICSYQRYI